MESSTRDTLQAAGLDPDSWLRLEKLLDGFSDFPGWFQQVDDSDFSLEDWTEALLAFDTWLDQKGKTERPVDSMIGYIHCCTLTIPRTLSPPNLSSVTTGMLDRYGFDAAAESSAEES